MRTFKDLIIALYTIITFICIGLAICVCTFSSLTFRDPNLAQEICLLWPTHWAYNISVFSILTIMAIFNILILPLLINVINKKKSNGGIIGTIFLAINLIFLISQFVGPILLYIAVYAQMYAPIIAIVCYIALLVLLITYLLLRSLRKNLSKRADWLKKINVVLGFIEASMGMKFLMTSDQCMHWGLLNREVYLTIQILIFLFMGLYLVWPSIAFIIGKVRHTQDVNIKDFPAISLALAIAAFSVVAYLLPGLSGDPLTKISGYLPPMTSHTKYIDAKRKYADFLNLPHNLSGHFDFEEAVADAKAQNKPIFVDVTGHASNNCREMEYYVWSNPKVKQMLEEDFVICALYVDDNTKIEGGERLGSKNAAFAQKKWGVNTQPTYLLLTPDGKEVIAGPRGYDRSIDGFVEFLETGKTGVK